ncbi:MAG: hypothetical protein LC739_04970 [Actinobacteria bacterium]|nr:hypothetical protein [Actinomycetota bacterium]
MKQRAEQVGGCRLPEVTLGDTHQVGEGDQMVSEAGGLLEVDTLWNRIPADVDDAVD